MGEGVLIAPDEKYATMTVSSLLRLIALLLLLATPAHTQDQPREALFGDDNIAVELLADGAPQAGETWMLALRFTPSGPEWHGYWDNPGDAGVPMALMLDLPDGWEVGQAVYPVPERLVIAGLMNHIYEGEYTVLVPVEVPPDAALDGPLTGFVEYLACTDEICVPQDARLRARTANEGFDAFASQVAPLLDADATYEVSGDRLRIALPLPAAVAVEAPHVFVRERELVDYNAVQAFSRKGDMLVAEIPLAFPEAAADGSVSGIIAYGDGEGLRFSASAGDVPDLGSEFALQTGSAPTSLPFGWALLGAFLGGIVLNVMPCVFPILSLKALSLAKAGGDEAAARGDALGYTAGVVVSCLALGGVLLALRAAGENVGWAFQLQEPGVVVALFLLTLTLTANFAGLFALPGMAVAGGSGRQSSFATGVLAAFVATPCTGPFMAAALGAALLLPTAQAMALFAALGLGLALPFLAVGFVPAIRARLPKPGPWMETFRRWMALPMGLTALALGWLLWRLGGVSYLLGVAAIGVVVLGVLAWIGKRQDSARSAMPIGLALTLASVAAIVLLPRPEAAMQSAMSLHRPLAFSQAVLDEARASGAPVFVWFTADWCVTCKVNEAAAIEREATAAAFEEAGVATIRGDWTRRDETITAFLFERGAAGVPLYLWYPPGGEAEQLPQLLTPEMLVSRANGTVQ